jgi:hypothetical protein
LALALRAREVDVRASPYDLSAYTYRSSQKVVKKSRKHEAARDAAESDGKAQDFVRDSTTTHTKGDRLTEVEPGKSNSFKAPSGTGELGGSFLTEPIRIETPEASD